MKIRDFSSLLVLIIYLTPTVITFRHHHRKRSMLEADPCLDEEDIEHPHEIVFPRKFEHLKRPWISDDEHKTAPKIFKGEGINYQWAWMKSLVVKGLRKSIEDILQFLNKKDCMFIPVGAMIRDLVLRNQPVFLSGEVSCNISMLYTECIKKFGRQVCSLYPIENGGWGEYRLEIGDSSVNSSLDRMRAEPVSIYGWRTILGQNPSKWSYTVDMMAIYDDTAGTTYLIDPTGRGYRDTCEKKLVATVEENSWKVWANNQDMKVMSFYDLRVNGFSVANSEFQRFVNSQIKHVDRESSQMFYCEHILKGVVSTGDRTSVCYTLYPEKEQSRRIDSMRNIMIKETGNTWNETVGGGGDQLEAVFLTTKQFVEVRDRIKHRIQSDEPISTETEPKLVIDGKPMIKDMAEVHKRPIYPMSEEPVKLPVEFPSLPNAKPDDKLEFHEQETQGAGYNDPIAYEVSREDEDASGARHEPDVITVHKVTQIPVVLPTDEVTIEDVTLSSTETLFKPNVEKSSLVEDSDYEAIEIPADYNNSNFKSILCSIFVLLIFTFF